MPIGQIIAAAMNLGQMGFQAHYNSPQQQMKRLEKLGFSKAKAASMIEGTGNIGQGHPVNFSADFGLSEVQKNRETARLTGTQADLQEAINKQALRKVRRSVYNTVQLGDEIKTFKGEVEMPYTYAEQRYMTQYNLEQEQLEQSQIKTMLERLGLQYEGQRAKYYKDLTRLEKETLEKNLDFLGVRTENEQALRNAYNAVQKTLVDSLGPLGSFLMMLLSKQTIIQ